MLKQSVKEFIESQYENIQTLHESDKSAITLVRNRQTDETFVMKRLKGNRDVYLKMKELCHPLLPKIIYSTVDLDETLVIEEYINGKSIAAEPWPEKDILNIMLQLCEVLSFLHKNVIIHRDIKPSNVLLTEDGTIRLIDFDAARIEKNDSEYDTELLGTRGYAAPEQYGFAQTSSRSDIYALGIIMGKLLGQNSKYRKIIEKCTDLNPDKRYKSANEVAKALSSAAKQPMQKMLVAATCIFVVLAGAATIALINPYTREPILESDASETGSTAQTTLTAQQTETVRSTSNSTSNADVFTAETTAATGAQEGNTSEGIKMEDVLFIAQKMNYIFLDSHSLKIDGKTAEMTLDLNGDGKKEHFELSRDHPNGLLFVGANTESAMNFYYDDWTQQIPDAFEDEFNDKYYVQISCCDLDNDGIKEVLVSVGDKMLEGVTAVYSLTGKTDPLFEYKGCIIGQAHLFLGDDYIVYAPIGSAGWQDTYQYKNGKLESIDLSTIVND